MSESIPPKDSGEPAIAEDAVGDIAGKPLDYAPHPPPTSLRRGWIATRRWMRDTFSREQLVAGLKQLAWVAPLTLLVWVWAEREQQDTAPSVRFALEVRASDPQTVVRLVEPADGFCSADFTGPRARLEELRGELAQRMGAVRFEVPGDLKEGQREYGLGFIINRDERFEGVTVSNAAPNRVTVVVDTIENETATVQVRKEDEGLYDSVQFSPPRVKVRVPRKTLATLPKDSAGRPIAYADLGALSSQSAGPKTDVSGVRVYVPNADDDVTVEPTTVSVSLNVKEQARTFPIPELTIFANVPPGLSETSFKIDPPSVVDVVLSGTPQAIEALTRNNAADVKAYVEIVGGDEGKGPLKKVPWFRTPEGTKVISWKVVDVANGPVEVTVLPR